MIFAGARAAVAPYLLWIKLGLLAVAFLGGCRAGCSWQADHDAAKLARKDAALVAAGAQLDAASAALRDIDARSKAEAKRLKDAAETNAKAAQAARAARDALMDRVSEFNTEIDRAKARDPGCRQLLETTSCLPFD